MGRSCLLPGLPVKLPGMASVRRRMLLNPFPPLPDAAVCGVPVLPARPEEKGWEARGGSSSSLFELLRRRRRATPARSPSLPVPLEGAGVQAVGVHTEARNASWNLCCFRPCCLWLDTADARRVLGALRGAQWLHAGPGLFENFRGRSAALRLAASR